MNTALVQEGLRQASQALRGHRSQAVQAPRDRDELWRWVRDHLGIEIPRESVCDDHCAPFDAFADAFFAEEPVLVWKASRGFGGKSVLLAALSMTEGATLGAKVNLLGGSGEQSQRVLNYMYGEEMGGVFWEAPDAPRHLVRGGYEKGALKKETKLNNNGYIRTLMASQRSVRGPHPERLRLDEIDEMDLSIYDAASGQTMATRGIPAQTVASSTHHNSGGTMDEILKRAAEKGWPVYEWCYKENLESNGGWLPESEVARKRKEMTETTFQVEVELQEPNPGSRAIDTDAVKKMFNSELGEFEGQANEVIEIALTSGDFYHGTDWGKRTHWTVYVTIQVPSGDSPARIVGFERRGRSPWPVMVGRLEERLGQQEGISCHDETGIGDVISDYVEGVETHGVWMSGKTRATMLSDYIVAIENGEIEAPRIKWAYDQHRLASQNDVFGSGKSAHLPDSIAAGALAWHAFKNKHEYRKKKIRATWGR